jgi:hypothetical protein
MIKALERFWANPHRRRGSLADLAFDPRPWPSPARARLVLQTVSGTTLAAGVRPTRLPYRRAIRVPTMPGSPRTKRRTSSRKRPFHCRMRSPGNLLPS